MVVSKEFLDPASVNGSNLQDLSGQVTDATPAQGDLRTVRLGISHVGAAISGGQITDSLPTQIRLADPVNARFSSGCGPSAVVATGSPGGGAFIATGLQVPSGIDADPGRCFIYFDVVSTVVGTWNNVIAAGGFTGNAAGVGVISNPDPAPRSLTVTGLSSLSVSKGFAPSTLLMGATTTLTITVANPNTGRPVRLTQLTEELPETLAATSPTPSISCSAGGLPGSVAASGTAGTVILTFAGGTEVAGGGSCVVSWTLTAVPSNGTSITSTNRIPANSVLNSRGLGHGIAQANVTVQSPITLAKSFAPATARAGEPVTLTISITNRSASAVTAVGFTDNPLSAPAGVTLLAPAAANSACGAPLLTSAAGGNSIVMSGASIGAGAVCLVTATVSAPGPQTYTNTIVAGATWTQGGFTQSTAAASATLNVFSGFRGFKSILDPRTGSSLTGGVVPGDVVRYRVELENFSTGQITGVSLTDPFPSIGGAQMVYATAATPGAANPRTNCTATGTPGVPGPIAAPATVQTDGAASVSFTGLVVPGNPSGVSDPGARCFIEFDARLPRNWPVGTNLVNSLPSNAISGGGGGGGGGGGSGFQNVVVSNVPVLNQFPISKSFSPSALSAGGTSIVTLALVNNGLYALDNVAVDDALPSVVVGTVTAQLRVATPANTTTNCGGTPVFTISAERDRLQVGGITVPARAAGAQSGQCQVSFAVVAPVPATWNNSATATGTDARTGETVNPPGPANATLVTTPSLTATKSFSPTPVAANGGNSTVTVTLGNIGAAALTNVSVNDPLPSGLRVASTPAAATTCAGPTAITANAGASSAQLTGATLPAGTTCTFTFNVVTQAAPNPVVNTIPAGSISAAGGVISTTPTSASLATFNGGGLNVEKQFSLTDLAGLGQPTRLTIRLSNTSTQALTGIAFTDTLPTGMVLTAAPNPTTTCGGTVNAQPDGTSIVFSGGTVAPGVGVLPAPAPATCVIAANVTLNRVGTLANTIPLNAVTTDQGLTNTNAAVANVTALATVGVTKRFTPQAVPPNTPALLTIAVLNNAGVDLTNLTVVDALPSGLIVSTPSNASTTCTGGSVTTRPSLLGGGRTDVVLQGAILVGSAGATTSCEVRINVQSAAQGAYANTIAPGNVTADGSISNTAPADATLNVRVAASVAKSFAAPTSRRVNEPIRLVVTISNPNTVPLTNVALTDAYPANVFNATTPDASTTCAGGLVTAVPSGTSARLTGVTVPASGSCTFAVDVLANVPGAWNNVIADGALTSAEGVTNAAPAAASFTTFNPPTLGKEFRPVQINAGGASLLRIVLGNPNAAVLTSTAVLSDTLPAAVSFGAPAISPGPDPQGLPACGATAAGSTLTLASGSSIPAGGCSILANVTASALGTYINSLPAGALQTSGGNNPQLATATLSVSALSSLTGTVFRDDNNNGVPNGGEPGYAGQSVELLDGTGAVVAATTTDALGNYAFLALAPGTYAIRQPAQPAGTFNGIASAGTGAATAGTASAPTVVPSVISGIVLGSGQNATGYNLGEVVPASLAGVAFRDDNNSGTQQSSEPALAGQTITLTGINDLGQAVSLGTSTDAGGAYSFSGLRPGTYTLTQPAQPFGTANGQTIAGSGASSNGTATVPTSTPSAISGIVLGSGQSGTGFNFAELPTALISGVVYVDRDRNSAFDPTDTGRIAAVTLRLVQGADCATGTTLQTTTTDGSGAYAFAGASAGGNYLICQTQPAAWGNGNANGVAGSNVIAITNLPSTGLAGNNFGEWGGELRGTVFLDPNNNGLRDGGEPGLASTLQLAGTDLDGRPVSRSATTDGSGNFVFFDLPGAGAGGFTVTQVTQPAGTVDGRTTAGSAGGVASAPGATPSRIASIALGVGASSVSNRFGELPAASLAGSVYLDANNNGQRDPGEPGVANQTIVITGTDDSGSVNGSVVTDADGNFSVSDLRPGTYTMTQPAQPPGTLSGRTTPGSGGGTATPPTTTPSAIAGIDLAAPGSGSGGNLFGEIPAGGVIAGRVWLDANNNGIVDAGENGIAGVTIELSGTDTTGATVMRTLVTDADGSYRFSGLVPGSYTVRQPEQPPGTFNGQTVAGTIGGTPTAVTTLPSAIGGINLGINQTTLNNNFGELPAGRISGSVYNDADNNGRREAGETGFAGQTVLLTGTDDLGRAVSLSTQTDADGNFSFTGLRPGSYTLTQPAQPPGTVPGITTAGTLNGASVGTASPVTALPSTIVNIVLPIGGVLIDNLFGELGNSPDVVASKTTSGLFAIDNPATWRITVANRGTQPTSGPVTVEDRLPPGIRLAAAPSGGGWTCSGAAGGQAFSCVTNAVIAAGTTLAEAIMVPVRVSADALPAGVNSASFDNALLVSGGGEQAGFGPTPGERDQFNGNPRALPPCAATPAQNACRSTVIVLRTASVSGTVWYDLGLPRRQLDNADANQPGWTVEIVDADAPGQPVLRRTTTGPDGRWRIDGLVPTRNYLVRFRDPDSGIVWAQPLSGERGTPPAPCLAASANPGNASTSSCVEAGSAPQLRIVLAPGDRLPEQSLPLDPGGVVYDSTTRQPIAGAAVTLLPVGSCPGWSPADHIAGANFGGYRIGSGGAISMTTGALGAYQFLFTPTAPAACSFQLTVTPPPAYDFVSQVLPPQPGTLTLPPAPGAFDVQLQPGPPPQGAPTPYWLGFIGGGARQQPVRNHIPLDPRSVTGISIIKSAAVQLVELGDSVEYSVRIRNTTAFLRPRVYVRDLLPAGFRFIAGSGRVMRGGTTAPIADPLGAPGPSLRFDVGAVPANGEITLAYRVRVGVGAQQGDGSNRAWASPDPNADCARDATRCSNESRWRVRVTAGVFTPEACVAGKVFVDCDGNHVQDAEELGVPGVRLWLQDGTSFVTDSEGKYSYCGLPPRLHVLKVDATTLPRGAVLTTSSNRNAGDAHSLFLDLKRGELHRGDFVIGSCTNAVLGQVKARRTQGEVSAPQNERPGERRGAAPYSFRGQAPAAPRQATDSADQQPAVRPRPASNEPGGSDVRR